MLTVAGGGVINRRGRRLQKPSSPAASRRSGRCSLANRLRSFARQVLSRERSVQRRNRVAGAVVRREILQEVVDKEFQAASCWGLIPSMNGTP